MIARGSGKRRFAGRQYEHGPELDGCRNSTTQLFYVTAANLFYVVSNTCSVSCQAADSHPTLCKGVLRPRFAGYHCGTAGHGPPFDDPTTTRRRVPLPDRTAAAW